MPLVRSAEILIGCTALGRGVHVRYVGSETRLLVSPLWFVATDLFRSWRELMPSPVGLSYVARVAPARYASRLMAAWFVAEMAGNKLAGSLAAYSETYPGRAFLRYLCCNCDGFEDRTADRDAGAEASDRRKLDEACVKGRSREYWGRPRRLCIALLPP